jgi:hypothetical protein
MAEAFTESKIQKAVKAAVPAGKTQVVMWADWPKGLGLKIRASGKHSWVYCELHPVLTGHRL